jgi:urease accessory protein
MAIMLNARRSAGEPEIQAEMDKLTAPWPVLSLSWGDRQRSRLAAMLPNGKAVAVILPRGEQMQHGDLLCGDAGERVWVQAATEALYKITASNPFELMRVVYHLANRHVKAMLTEGAVFIEPDTVLAAMVQGLGGRVQEVEEAFHPEGGAYSGAHAHGHAHGHVHGEHCNHGVHDHSDQDEKSGQGAQGGHGKSSGHHHHHGEDPAVQAQDQALGNLGEQLSIAAHARSKA